MKKPICPQGYDGIKMFISTCTRCCNWNKVDKACHVYVGVEHLRQVRRAKIPDCPAADRCQHQLQLGAKPCPVRARGLLCESVVGVDHPLAFNATDY